MSITVAMIDPVHGTPPISCQTLIPTSRLILQWNHDPGSTLSPRWPRLVVDAATQTRYSPNRTAFAYSNSVTVAAQGLNMLAKTFPTPNLPLAGVRILDLTWVLTGPV